MAGRVRVLHHAQPAPSPPAPAPTQPPLTQRGGGQGLAQRGRQPLAPRAAGGVAGRHRQQPRQHLGGGGGGWPGLVLGPPAGQGRRLCVQTFAWSSRPGAGPRCTARGATSPAPAAQSRQDKQKRNTRDGEGSPQRRLHGLAQRVHALGRHHRQHLRGGKDSVVEPALDPSRRPGRCMQGAARGRRRRRSAQATPILVAAQQRAPAPGRPAWAGRTPPGCSRAPSARRRRCSWAQRRSKDGVGGQPGRRSRSPCVPSPPTHRLFGSRCNQVMGLLKRRSLSPV